MKTLFLALMVVLFISGVVCLVLGFKARFAPKTNSLLIWGGLIVAIGALFVITGLGKDLASSVADFISGFQHGLNARNR